MRQFLLKMEQSLFDHLSQQAKRWGMSVSAYIRMILVEKMEKDQGEK